MHPIFHGLYYSTITVKYQCYFVYSILAKDNHVIYSILFKFFFLLCPYNGYSFTILSKTTLFCYTMKGESE